MGLGDDFRKRAIESFQWAKGGSALGGAAWLSLAQFWLQRAQTLERNRYGCPMDDTGPTTGDQAGQPQTQGEQPGSS